MIFVLDQISAAQLFALDVLKITNELIFVNKASAPSSINLTDSKFYARWGVGNKQSMNEDVCRKVLVNDQETKTSDARFLAPKNFLKKKIKKEAHLVAYLVNPLVEGVIRQYMDKYYEVVFVIEDKIDETSLVRLPDISMKNNKNELILPIEVKFFFFDSQKETCPTESVFESWIGQLIEYMELAPRVQHGVLTTFYQTWIVKKITDKGGKSKFVCSKPFGRQDFLKALFYVTIVSYHAFNKTTASGFKHLPFGLNNIRFVGIRLVYN
jgi:hypothetical protein